MKSSFKKIVGIGLLCFASVMCGASSASEKREQAQQQLLLSQEEFDKISFKDAQWMPPYLESIEDKINYGKRVFASKNFKIMCENGTEIFLICCFLQRIFGNDRKGIEAFVLRYVRENFELLTSAAIMQLIYYIGSEKSACLKQLIDSRRLVNLDKKTIDILFEERHLHFECSEDELDVVNVLLDAFFEATTPYCIMYLLSKVRIGNFNEKNLKLRKGYLKRLAESGRLQSSCDFNTLFTLFLLDHEKKYVAMLEGLSDEQLKVVSDYCSYEKQEAFLRKNGIDANQRALSLINAQSFLLESNTFLLQFLEDHFNELTNDCLIPLIARLNDKRIFYVERLLEAGKLVNVDRKVILSLCSGKIGKDVARVLLENEKFFKDASAFVIVSLLNLAYTYDEPLPRMRCLTCLLDTGKLQVSPDIKTIVNLLRFNEKEDVLEVLKDKELGAYQTVCVASELPFEEEQTKLQLLQNNIFWKTCCPSGDQEVEGSPLFSKNFLLRNSSSIIELLLVHLRTDKTNHFQKMMPAIAQFTKEEYRKDRLVFFHGQHDSWAFLGNLFDALIAIKNGQSVPEDFVRLRFQERPVIGSDEVYAYRKCAKDRKNIDRFAILFATLHLLENDGGSNSLMYVYANFDQKIKGDVNIKAAIEAAIKAFFAELDMLLEYDALIKETPTLFTDLYDLYKKDVVARGDTGRLVAISMPKEIAQKLAYTADISGYFNGDGDVVRRAKNYCDSREYCVIFGKEMTDPLEAQKAGIRMASFTTDANEESLPLAHEYKEKLGVILARIADLLHQQREEHARAFRNTCLFSLSCNYLVLVGATQKQHHDVLVGQSEELQLVD